MQPKPRISTLPTDLLPQCAVQHHLPATALTPTSPADHVTTPHTPISERAARASGADTVPQPVWAARGGGVARPAGAPSGRHTGGWGVAEVTKHNILPTKCP